MDKAPEDLSSSPLLVVLSGPSGVGKDAALDALKRLDRPWRFGGDRNHQAQAGVRRGWNGLHIPGHRIVPGP